MIEKQQVIHKLLEQKFKSYRWFQIFSPERFHYEDSNGVFHMIKSGEEIETGYAIPVYSSHGVKTVKYTDKNGNEKNFSFR